MASINLYPPIVNSTEPAFLVKDNSVSIDDRGILRINFYLSALSGEISFDTLNVHVKIQNSKSVKVLNTRNDSSDLSDGVPEGRYRLRGAGMILNLTPQRDEQVDGLYYVEIKAKDIANIQGTYVNWIPGWIYKIQIRLSSVLCGINPLETSSEGQEAWLFENQNNFSEWSSIVYAKAISEMDLKLLQFTDKFQPSGQEWTPPVWNNGEDGVFPAVISGYLKSGITYGQKEYYKTYRIKIKYFEQGTIDTPVGNISALNFIIFEDSGDIFPTEDKEKVEYRLRRKLRNVTTTYNLNFSYVTANGYEGEVDYYFTYTADPNNISRLKVYTAENQPQEQEYDLDFDGVNPTFNQDGSHEHTGLERFSAGYDEEEGRVSLKIKYIPDKQNPQSFPDYAGENGINYCIRRASSMDGFDEWIPIHYGYLPPIDDIENYDEYKDIKFDYTVESGIWYKYGIEELSDGAIVKINYPDKDSDYTRRIFDHSYLLGEGGKQLKICYDPSISSFNDFVSDTKLEPVGSRYPYISRNAITYYKTFPIGGLVSFQSDEEKLFFDDEKYYNHYSYEYGEVIDIVSKNKIYNEKHNINERDFILERDFRREVLNFLQDGKPKLFKSSTEGNIIVRLMDVSMAPNQVLSRLVSSFTANANEYDEYNMNNCLKYGFYNPGTYQQVTVVTPNNE